jgi:predicted ATPase
MQTMYLQELEIKNYRSLEHVTLDHIGRLNVLIGRNNSGKSSVFGALSLLSRALRNQIHDQDRRNTLTDQEPQRSLEIRLLFKPQQKDREEFVQLLCELGLGEDRRQSFLESPLLRQMEFLFRTPNRSSSLSLYLRHARLLAQDGHWATMQEMVGDERSKNPLSQIANIRDVLFQPPGSLWKEAIEASSRSSQRSLSPSYPSEVPFHSDEATAWLLSRVDRYLSQSFFFNPFRHSVAQMGVQESLKLSQDGGNLAQVLSTIHNNDRPRFYRIEEFLHSALPDVGGLQTPLSGTSTEVAFRATNRDYLIRLHDMGGGVEQLLMIATVLLTTDDESTLFVEEPESHLHAGTQRFLFEKLCMGNRQVFITTHSPTFINSAQSKSIYQVKLNAGRTSIKQADKIDSLSATLEDIGKSKQ